MYFRQKLIVFVLLLAPFAAFAQVRLGPTVGTSLLKWKFSEADKGETYSSATTAGYHGGLAANYKVNEHYSLHTEWLYMYRQKNVSYTRNLLVAHDQASLHYLAVPALFRVSFHSEFKKSHQEWYVNAGPALHYWLGGRGKLKTNDYAPFLTEGTMDYKIRFSAPGEYGEAEYIQPANRWQMALYAGGGVIFDLGFGKHLWLDARTSLGAARSFFSTSSKGDYGLQYYKDNLQSSVMSYSLSVGYFQDINMHSVLKKGKSVHRKPKVKKKLRKNYGGATSGK